MTVLNPSPINTKLGVDTDNLSPEVRERLTRFFRDDRVGKRYLIHSAARSHLHQIVLFAIYKAGGNLAAEPGTSLHEFGVPGRRWALAVDIHPVPGRGGSYAEMHRIAKEYGFYFPILSELWHMQLWPGRGPLPLLEEEEVPDQTMHGCMSPSGMGRWILKRDGAVETYNFDPKRPIPFFGSMHDYPKEQAVKGRYFVSIEPRRRHGFSPEWSDGFGYVILSSDGGAFIFDKVR